MNPLLNNPVKGKENTVKFKEEASKLIPHFSEDYSSILM